MRNLVHELSLVLCETAALYEQVLARMEEERQALLSRHPDQVLDVVRRKETLLMQIKTLEESRRLICIRLARQFEVPVGALNLEKIQDLASPEDGQQLAKVRLALRETMAQLERANEMNARLCQNGMEIVRQIMQAVAQDSSESEMRYTPLSNGPSAATRAYGFNSRA